MRREGSNRLYMFPYNWKDLDELDDSRVPFHRDRAASCSLLRSEDRTWGAQINPVRSSQYNDINPQVTRKPDSISPESEAASLFLNNVHRRQSHTSFHLLLVRRLTRSSTDHPVIGTATRSQVFNRETHHAYTSSSLTNGTDRTIKSVIAKEHI